MGNFEADIIGVLKFLLPGFLTAWIFYGLTAHPKKSEFERVIQAMIFTALIQFAVISVRKASVLIGQWRMLGLWTDETTFVVSMVLAVPLGLLIAWCANNNQPHKKLADWTNKKLTKRTTAPSEWFNTFNTNEQVDVVLYLKGDRKLVGYPFEWPDHPDTGHFVLQDAVWVGEGEQRFPMRQSIVFLVPAAEVEMVEFLKPCPPEGAAETSENGRERTQRREPDADRRSDLAIQHERRSGESADDVFRATPECKPERDGAGA